MVQAIWKGQVIAESDRTVVVEGNHYFPRADVKSDCLHDSKLTTVCSWKGDAKYHDVVVDGEVNKDAAWYYPAPKDAAKEITDHVAFWKGVKVE